MSQFEGKHGYHGNNMCHLQKNMNNNNNDNNNNGEEGAVGGWVSTTAHPKGFSRGRRAEVDLMSGRRRTDVSGFIIRM